MQRVNTKKGKKPNITLTRAQLNKIKVEISNDAVTKSVCLFIAYMMEEEEINFDAERIGNMVDGIDRWAAAVDDHLITLRQVADIINDKTGIAITW